MKINVMFSIETNNKTIKVVVMSYNSKKELKASIKTDHKYSVEQSKYDGGKVSKITENFDKTEYIYSDDKYTYKYSIL